MYCYFPSRYAWQVHRVWNSTWFGFCGYGSKTNAYKFHDLICYSLRSQVNFDSACVSHMCLHIIFWLICREPIIFIIQVHIFLSITISMWEAWNLCVKQCDEFVNFFIGILFDLKLSIWFLLMFSFFEVVFFSVSFHFPVSSFLLLSCSSFGEIKF